MSARYFGQNPRQFTDLWILKAMCGHKLKSIQTNKHTFKQWKTNKHHACILQSASNPHKLEFYTEL